MSPILVSAAVEGLVDEAVVQRLIRDAGAEPGTIYGKNGKPALRKRIRGYANAAKRSPWIILVDLNGDHDCAPSLRSEWLRDSVPSLCFRVAVRAVEAWLLADSETLSEYLAISPTQVPPDPEALPDPKRSLVDLARRSSRRTIREDIVPRAGSGRSVGPAYTARAIEFVLKHWRPQVSAGRADSLQRAIDCLKELMRSSDPGVERGLFP